MILTRLLFPEAFGAIAAASALISGLVLVSDFGVHAVVVRSPRGDQVDFLHSAWAFQLWRGVAVWIILLGLCALLSVPAIQDLLPTTSVFVFHSFPLLTACLGFTIVLDGAQSMCIPLNVRSLNYRPTVIINLASRLLSIPIMIIWAWAEPSVWAIVGGGLAASFFNMVLSHAWVPGPRMGLNWEKDHLQEIVHFGRWIAVSSFGTFVYQQCDVILLGILMPSSALGLYWVAKLLVGVGEGFLNQIGSSLSLPIFAEVLRRNPNNLLERYYRFRLPMELTAALLAGGLFASGNFIVNFLYDPRYAQAGLMLQILALGTAFYPLLLIRDAFNATGDSHVGAFLSVLQAASLIMCLVIGFFAFGALGAIGGVALHRVIPSVITIFLARRRSWVLIWQELRIVPIFIVGLLLGKGIVLIATALGVENIHQIFYYVHRAFGSIISDLQDSWIGMRVKQL